MSTLLHRSEKRPHRKYQILLAAICSLGFFHACALAALPAPTVTYSTVAANGYNGTNSINSVAISRNNLVTIGDYQYIAYYDSNSVRLGRRSLASNTWSVFDTGYTPYAITDDHDNIAIAIDGNGYMHMSWGMHNNSMNYVVSNNPVTSVTNWNGANVPFTRPTFWNQTAGNTHSSVTYPEFYRIPGSNDLLFLYRQGGSGNGNQYLVRYNAASKTWSKNLIIQGTSDSINAYLNNLVYDSTGKLLMTWTFRDTPAFQSNENIMYAESLDNGQTWRSQTATPYSLPITRSQAQVVSVIPENSTLINQTTMTVDKFDRPLVATWYAPAAAQGNNTRQYMLEWFDGVAWQSSQVTNRPTESLQTDSTVRELARPIVLVDDDNRVLMVLRYKEIGNSVVVAVSDDRVNWETLTLSTENMGVWEPTYDSELWKRENKLHLFYQRLGTSGSNTVSVLQWDAKAYFAALPHVNYWASTTGGLWTDSTWSSGVPNGAGVSAGLGGGATALAAPATVTLTSPQTVGSLIFKNATYGFTVNATGTGTLLLDNSGSPATISAALGSHAISAPVTVPSVGATLNVSRDQDTLLLSGTISGGPLTKTGPGTLTLAGTTNVTTITVASGVLRVGDGATSGSTGSTPITLSGGTLAFARSDHLLVSANISGEGMVRQDGPGTLSFSGTQNFSALGVNAGRLLYTPSIPAGVGLTVHGGLLDLNGRSPTISSLSGSGGLLSDSSPTPGVSTLTISAGSGVSTLFAGAVQGTSTRLISLVKTGTGSLTLAGSAANANFTVQQGDLGYAATGAFGNGTVTVTPLSASSSADARARLLLSNGVTLANPVVVNGVNTNFSGSILVPGANDSATITGTITVNDGFVGSGNTLFGPTGAGLLTVAGPINNNSSMVVGMRNGNVRFAYPGGTTTGVSAFRINQGSASLGANNGLPPMATLDIAPSGTASLDLRGYDQTLVSVTRSAGGASATITNSDAAVRSRLTTTSGSDFTLPAALTGNLSYHHTGAGTVTLTVSPNNTGEVAADGPGRLIVNPILRSGAVGASNGGTLLLNLPGSPSTFVQVANVGAVVIGTTGTVTLPAVNRATTRQKVLVAGTVDIAGRLDLTNNDMIVRSSTEEAVRAAVATWWNHGQRDGTGIGSSLANPSTLTTLGVIPNTNGLGGVWTSAFDDVPVTHTDVLLKYTYIGDTDFSGLVDSNDLANLIAGLRSNLTGWRNGDLNYDGVIDANDMASLLWVMRLQGTTLASGGDAGEHLAPTGGAIPEPSPSAAALLLALTTLTRRAKRHAP